MAADSMQVGKVFYFMKCGCKVHVRCLKCAHGPLGFISILLCVFSGFALGEAAAAAAPAPAPSAVELMTWENREWGPQNTHDNGLEDVFIPLE